MELNWSTFVLEIINFLVLVWILHRFLYRPVLDIIAQRHRQIEGVLAEATRQREEGETLKKQYENRLVEWEGEKAAARKTLEGEIAEERGRRREELKVELEAERRKAQVIDERERDERDKRIEGMALDIAGRFATQLLTRIAGPEVERKLVEVALEDLPDLPPGELGELRRAWRAEEGAVEVTSAGVLDEVQRRALEEGLEKLLEHAVTCRYREDPSIISGLRIRVGAWMLQANLEDELKSFAEAAR